MYFPWSPQQFVLQPCPAVLRVTVLKDGVYLRAPPTSLHHHALVPLIHHWGPSCGQRYWVPGVGTNPPPPLPSGEPVSVAGPAHPHHPGPAHDHAAPLPGDRSVHRRPADGIPALSRAKNSINRFILLSSKLSCASEHRFIITSLLRICFSLFNMWKDPFKQSQGLMITDKGS